MNDFESDVRIVRPMSHTADMPRGMISAFRQTAQESALRLNWAERESEPQAQHEASVPGQSCSAGRWSAAAKCERDIRRAQNGIDPSKFGVLLEQKGRSCENNWLCVQSQEVAQRTIFRSVSNGTIALVGVPGNFSGELRRARFVS